ncbi:MAG: CBS domain-containing protein [Proteobacteria bacterium]|nr:CBS domain-containing protein [Pseudomonadota bacterium]
MKVIFGHSNMDLDCFGSIALIKYLYPDYQLVQSNLIHPAARNLYNLYQNRFEFINAKELANQTVEKIIVVDTRSKGRVKEFFKHLDGFDGEIDVFDHHPSGHDDIEGATIHYGHYGSNSTFIGLELMKQGVKVEPEDATIGLTGIYADTGCFQHDNVTSEDLEVASYLLKNGASVTLAKKFLETLSDRQQITLFRDVMNRVTHKDINGHSLILAYVELQNQVGGLAEVIEKVFDVEKTEAIFCVFYFTHNNDSLVIARSAKDTIRLDTILQHFGGGGHIRAASALIKNKSGMMVFAELEEYLKKELQPAVKAEQIMITDVSVIRDSMSLKEASMLLEQCNHTGAPVLSQRGELVGFLTLRDIMKGRKNDQMNSSVKGYMSAKVVSATKDVTFREIEELLFKNNIGHLPIVQGKSLLGIITRTDYLQFMSKQNR